MSSSIYQGLQSCLEPPLMKPRVLRLKLTPATPAQDHSDLSATHSHPQIKPHLEMGQNDAAAANGVGGRSFLQALSSDRYVHSPAMALSEKSLEMCTESLGSETGSDGSEIGGDEKMSLFSSDGTEIPPSSASGEKSSRFSRLRGKKHAKPSYLPPLTSMSGPMGVKVKPYREGGRLVLKAVSISSAKQCFEVERSGGRLRLRLLKHCSLLSNNLEEVEEEVEEKGEREEEEEESNESGGRRPKGRRCKEGGGGRKEPLLNWEPFLVST